MASPSFSSRMVDGFLGHGFWLFVAQGAYALLSLVAMSMATAALGPKGYGAYSLFLSVGTVLAIFSHTWLHNGIYKKCIDQQADAKPVGSVLGTGLVLLLFSYAVVFGFIALFHVRLSAYLGLHPGLIFFLGLYLLVTGFSMLATYVFRSLGAFKLFALALPVERGVFLLILWLALRGTAVLTPEAVIGFLLTSHAVFLLMAFALVDRKKIFPLGFDTDLLRPILRFSWPFILTSLVAFAGQSIEIFLVEHFLDRESLGIYALGLQFLNMGAQILLVLNTVMTQVFVALVREEKTQSIERFYSRIVPHVILGVLLGLWVITAIFPSLFGLIFPRSFQMSSDIALQFFSPLFSFAIFTLLHPLLFAHEKTLRMTWINLIPLVITLPLYFIVVQSQGLAGVAAIRGIFYFGVALLAIRWAGISETKTKWKLLGLLMMGQVFFSLQPIVNLSVSYWILFALIVWGIFAACERFPNTDDRRMMQRLLPKFLKKGV